MVINIYIYMIIIYNHYFQFFRKSLITTLKPLNFCPFFHETSQFFEFEFFQLFGPNGYLILKIFKCSKLMAL